MEFWLSLGSCRIAFSRWELEGHFTRIIDNEPRREISAALGNKFVEQVSLAILEQLLDLFRRHRLVQDRFAGAELTSFLGRLAALADVFGFGFENAAFAFRAFA